MTPTTGLAHRVTLVGPRRSEGVGRTFGQR